MNDTEFDLSNTMEALYIQCLYIFQYFYFLKKQNTVETKTYGSEYVASSIAAEQIIDIRNTLRFMGIPIGRSVLFEDNLSVVNSSMHPHGKLTKRHMALSFHRVRECIAVLKALSTSLKFSL
jgi:hypothetical protein